MIKEEQWRNIQLGEVLELIRNGYSGKQVNYITEFPVSRIETISDGKIDLSKVGFVEKIPESYLLNEGDMLFSNINSIKHIGKIAYVKEGLKLYHGMNLLIFRISHGVNSKFLYYKLVQSKQWFEKMAAQAVNQASINQEEIKKCPIIIPNLFDEQSKIAEILETVDSAIEKTEELIAKQVRIKTGLMQDLLTKGIDENGNIRSEETHEFKDSPVGRIPVEWEVNTLGNVADIIMGQSPDSKFYSDEKGIPFLQGSAEFGKRYPKNIQFCSQIKKVAPLNSILISVRAPVGDINIADKEYIIGRGLAAILLKKADADFVENYLSLMKDEFRKKAQGSTFEAISKNDISEFVLALPRQREEQYEIVKIISALSKDINRNYEEVGKLKQLKTGLMQDLLSGKKRVTSLLDDLEVVS